MSEAMDDSPTVPALPRHPQDVTARWLSTALAAAGLDVEVGAVRRERLGEGAVSYTHLTLPTNREV